MAAFDEMHGLPRGGVAGDVRPAYRRVAQWLTDAPADLLDARRRQAELFFRRIGITFAVYGEEEAAERLIPFDIVPRIISPPRMERLEAGLNSASRRSTPSSTTSITVSEIVKRRRVPEELVLCNDALPPGDAGLSTAGRRLCAHRRHRHRARRRRTTFYVLEDNLPHALGRVLHAREPRDDDAAVPGAVLPGTACAPVEPIRTCCSRPCACVAPAGDRRSDAWWC